ncbi:DUF1833 family protein [Microvirga sp. GCM10011540]|uniref:DUF1833 family protein n=1 Tax=Microvirga sp. GCM10011540 TaxID=3317338 RepID=UPI003620DF30
MSLTDAIKEAYADPDLADVVIDTLELDHPAFAEPIRIVPNADSDMTLGGHLHQALGMSISLQGFDDDGPTTGVVSIENVSSMLVPYLRDAVQAGSPITVTYRAYLASNLSAPGEVRGGMFLSKVSLSATTATGTLEASSKHDRQAFPRLVYSLSTYKALHGG